MRRTYDHARWGLSATLWLVAATACRDPGTGTAEAETDTDPPATTGSSKDGTSTGGGGSSETDGTTGADGTDEDEDEDDRLLITHYFGNAPLMPYDDNADRCVSWTLNNEKALYIQSVIMANEGSFHHSNWFIVPEDEYGGPDGFWNCEDRGYTEPSAGQKGSVLFAQSTQSYLEEQSLSPGSVIKIPPRYKIVAGIHTLNTSPLEGASGLWLSLEPIHPRDVAGVVTALSMQYKDLEIPPLSERRFTADCDLSVPYGLVTFEPLALRVHYILPHYHYLGNHFEVVVEGGLRDGEILYSLEGFNGEPNGITFDPPLDLPGATGLKMTCGYDNWTNETVTWGNGEGEMCVMLALIESKAKFGASVEFGSQAVDVEDGVPRFEGTCLGVAWPNGPEAAMPSQEEIDGELYLPPIDPDDQGLPPIPDCRNAKTAAPHEPATLESIDETIFAPSCTFSACHGQSAAAGLDLTAADLRQTLLDRDPLVPTDMPLVAPGDPEGSWLYHLLSRCEPTTEDGFVANHMPLNAPFLLPDPLVAKVRVWIENGAP